jgi:phosphoribosyl 1,2-cyclic phosphodiesterase
MALFITSLNSGSNGNCYYVGNQREAVLVDVGLSCRETEKRMLRLGLSMQKVKAIFISHEHSDHIKGLPLIAKKYQLPVYITPGTLKNGRLLLENHLVKPLRGYEPVQIGELTVTAFPKFHDAAEPHSFIVSCRNVKVGVFTDIGCPCENLVSHFKQCHAAFLEANYDEKILSQGNYPYHLKRRITGGYGHLSNRQALELFKVHKPEYMSHLLLAHLSKDNNCPDLARNMFMPHAGSTQVIVASRYEETPVYAIKHTGTNEVIVRNYQPQTQVVQYQLF